MQPSDELKAPRRSSRVVNMRLIICILTTLCPAVCYISRVNLSLAIVAMVSDSKQAKNLLTTTQVPTTLNSHFDHMDIETPDTAHHQNSPKTFGPKYDWSESQANFLMGSFFWTYVIFQIPAARLAELLGTKWVLATAAIGSSILSLLSPLAASISVETFIAVRLVLGVCQTALYPAAYILYCKWLPPNERSMALPILYAAAYAGSIISSLGTGFLCGVESLGWEYSFYLPGVVCAIWSIVWIFVASNTPRENRFISIKELEFIETNLESATREKELNEKSTDKEISWRKIGSSEPVWALIYAFLGSNWSFTIVLLIVPSYLNYVIGVETSMNGIIMAVIYGVYCVCCPLVGTISTMMVETRSFGLTRLQIRKIFQSIGKNSFLFC